MRRMHLIELHEQPWYPAVLRTLFQDGLGWSLRRMNVYENVAEPFARMLDRIDADAILDLCSGSAEVVLQVSAAAGKRRRSGQQPIVHLSDLFPSVDRYREHVARHPGAIDFLAESVDARHVPRRPDLPRVRTMFTALHHFQPDDVRAILTDAAHHADGFAAFEMTGRTWLNLLAASTALVPMMGLTAFGFRPFRWINVVHGLLLPIAPMTMVIDAVVSCLRTYTVEELREIVGSIDAPDFEWEIDTVPIPRNPLRATYIIGWRRSVAR